MARLAPAINRVEFLASVSWTPSTFELDALNPSIVSRLHATTQHNKWRIDGSGRLIKTGGLGKVTQEVIHNVGPFTG